VIARAASPRPRRSWNDKGEAQVRLHPFTMGDGPLGDDKAPASASGADPTTPLTEAALQTESCRLQRIEQGPGRAATGFLHAPEGATKPEALAGLSAPDPAGYRGSRSPN